MNQAIAEVRLRSSESHVLLVVANDAAKSATASVGDLLHNVAEVVDEEVDLGVAVDDGAEKTIHGADDIVDDISHCVEEVDQERVQIEGCQGTVDNVDKISEADDKLELR